MTPSQANQKQNEEAKKLAKNLKKADKPDWDDPDWEDDLNPKGTDAPESEIESQLRRYRQLENKLRSLQITYDLNKKNTATLIKENQAVLKSKIKEHKQTISEQTALITKYKSALRQRNNRITKFEARIAELEEQLGNTTTTAPSEQKTQPTTPAPPLAPPPEPASTDAAVVTEVVRVYEAQIEALTQQKMVLHRTGEYYRSLFTCSAEAMLIIDPQSRRIEQSNQAAATLFGMGSPDDLNGNTIDALSPNRQPNNKISQVKIKAKLQEAIEKNNCVFEHQFTAENGVPFNTITSFGAIKNSHANDLIAVIHDISKIKPISNEPPKELLEARKELEEAWEISRQNSGILKQINTAVESSLTPIIKTARSLAEEQNLSDRQLQTLDDISSNSRYLIGMINYLASLGAIADGSLTATEAEVNLHTIINQLDQIYSKQADAKKLFFAISYAQQKSEHQIPERIITDQEKIEYILKTLLTYAMRSTDKGRLGLHARRAENNTDSNTAEIIFELAFTGSAGKNDPVLNKVFLAENELAGTFDPELDFELALTRQYAHLLGGDVALEFRQGNITSFTFNFTSTIADGQMLRQNPGKDADEKEPANESTESTADHPA